MAKKPSGMQQRRGIKRFLPRGLFARALMIIVLPLILLQMVVAFIFFETHWNNVSRRMAVSLAGDIAATLDLLAPDSSDAHFDDIRALAAKRFQLRIERRPPGDIPASDISFFDRSAHVLTRSLKDSVPQPFSVAFPTDLIVIHIRQPDHVLRITTVGKRMFSHTTDIFLIWMLGTSIVLIAIAVAFMRNQVRPINRLAKAADSFGMGHDTPDFKPEGATEVRQAAKAFVRMRARIKRHLNERTGMLAGVSHDLRTPLTRMKLQLAMQQDSEGRRELEEDIHEMERMLDGYLAFARGEGTEDMVQTDLDAIVADAVDQARRGPGMVNLTGATGVTLPLKPSAFKRSLDNLLQNALRYGTAVTVDLQKSALGVTLTIDDNGPGIPEDERENVFRPFYRIEASRNLDTGGIGLGLAIARDVVQAHGGQITLGEAPTGGLRVSVGLPL